MQPDLERAVPGRFFGGEIKQIVKKSSLKIFVVEKIQKITFCSCVRTLISLFSGSPELAAPVVVQELLGARLMPHPERQQQAPVGADHSVQGVTLTE